MTMFIPNSTQTHNDYFDKFMPYLSGNEWKVLCFAIRHIMGFHDRISTRTRAMSLSMFERGYGVYNGCGLGRSAIISALKTLEEFRLLIPIGDPTPDGQEWHLHENPDLDGLVKRYLAQKKAHKKQTKNARAVANGIPCDCDDETDNCDEVVCSTDQQAVCPTDQQVVCSTDQSQSVQQTDGGLFNRHKEILL